MKRARPSTPPSPPPSPIIHRIKNRKVCIYNCNRLEARIDSPSWPSLVTYFDNESFDIIFLTEIKVFPASFGRGSNRGVMRDGPVKDKITEALESPPFNLYNKHYSLCPYGDEAQYGQVMLVKKSIDQPTVTFNIESIYAGVEAGVEHELDGRVIVADFNDVKFVHTYSPLSYCFAGKNEHGGTKLGWKVISSKKYNEKKEDRYKWDYNLIKAIWKHRRVHKNKPIILCGDQNVNVDEYIRATANNPHYKETDPKFIDLFEERKRFYLNFLACRLLFTDAYRLKQPDYDPDTDFTHKNDKYNTKSRLDYFLVTPELKEYVDSCNVFPDSFGSDHRILVLELKEKTTV